jgi:hypothetical protein
MPDLVPHVDGLVYGPHFRHNFDYYPNASASQPGAGRPWILITALENENNLGGRFSVRDENDPAYGGRRAWFDFITYFTAAAQNDPPFDVFVCDVPWNRMNPQTVNFDAEKLYERTGVDYWPLNVESFQLCYQYIRQHASDFGNLPNGHALNPDQGAYAGWSASGTMALLAGYRPSLPWSDPGTQRRGVASQGQYQVYSVPSTPAWVIDRSGIPDMRPSFFQGFGSELVGLLGVSPATEIDDLGILDEISSINFITGDTPPTIIIQDSSGFGAGTPPYSDPHHPNIGLDLQAALNAAGVSSQYTTTADGVSPMSAAAIAACYAFGRSTLGF